MTFKPLLAAKATMADVHYPAFATPKIDGIRCLITVTGPATRKLKAIPNHHIRELLTTLPVGLDGELWIPGAKCFGDVSTAVMAHDGKPDFRYLVFDNFETSGGYLTRVEKLRGMNFPEWVTVLEPERIENEEALLAYERTVLYADFEGVMLRSERGPYKHGRSTVREGTLLKLKRFEDDEAVVYGYQELLHNENAAEQDALGHTKRSTAQAGKTAGGMLGALMLRTPDGIEFNVGTGFTQVQREALWEARQDLLGLTVKYRHQGAGAKTKPRFPSFLGFRHPND